MSQFQSRGNCFSQLFYQRLFFWLYKLYMVIWFCLSLLTHIMQKKTRYQTYQKILIFVSSASSFFWIDKSYFVILYCFLVYISNLSANSHYFYQNLVKLNKHHKQSFKLWKSKSSSSKWSWQMFMSYASISCIFFNINYLLVLIKVLLNWNSFIIFFFQSKNAIIFLPQCQKSHLTI